jgi:DNA-binding CsgD family transcriptional regulator
MIGSYPAMIGSYPPVIRSYPAMIGSYPAMIGSYPAMIRSYLPLIGSYPPLISIPERILHIAPLIHFLTQYPARSSVTCLFGSLCSAGAPTCSIMPAPYTLSPRQVQVLILLAEEYTLQEVADRLYISPHTVRTHRHNIRHQLNVSSITSAIILALQLGIISVTQIHVRLTDPQSTPPPLS